MKYDKENENLVLSDSEYETILEHAQHLNNEDPFVQKIYEDLLLILNDLSMMDERISNIEKELDKR